MSVTHLWNPENPWNAGGQQWAVSSVRQPWQCVLFDVMIPCSSTQNLQEDSATCGFWQEPHTEKMLGTLSEVTCRNQTKGQICTYGTYFPNLVMQPRCTKFIYRLLRYQNFWIYLCPDTGEINYSCIKLPSLVGQIYHGGIFYGIWLMWCQGRSLPCKVTGGLTAQTSLWSR